jgi:hypothetical protein
MGITLRRLALGLTLSLTMLCQAMDRKIKLTIKTQDSNSSLQLSPKSPDSDSTKLSDISIEQKHDDSPNNHLAKLDLDATDNIQIDIPQLVAQYTAKEMLKLKDTKAWNQLTPYQQFVCKLSATPFSFITNNARFNLSGPKNTDKSLSGVEVNVSDINVDAFKGNTFNCTCCISQPHPWETKEAE